MNVSCALGANQVGEINRQYTRQKEISSNPIVKYIAFLDTVSLLCEAKYAKMVIRWHFYISHHILKIPY